MSETVTIKNCARSGAVHIPARALARPAGAEVKGAGIALAAGETCEILASERRGVVDDKIREIDAEGQAVEYAAAPKKTAPLPGPTAKKAAVAAGGKR